MKRVAILQSNYIPWRGYFDIIGLVDEFIVYDEVQYTKNDWRNRNRIKTREGLRWLSVPVGVKISRRIHEVDIQNPLWQRRHWEALHHSYSKARFYPQISKLLAPVYLEMRHTNLSSLNVFLIKEVCRYLGINTKITDSRHYQLEGDRTNRLIHLCRQSEAFDYLSGPSAKNYLDEAEFKRSGITIHWMDYSNYPSYEQLWGSFEPSVSILDLLFNLGEASRNHMKFSSALHCRDIITKEV